MNNGMVWRTIIKLEEKSIWSCYQGCVYLTHWGRVTHICVSKLTIIGSDNGLALDRRQAIIWTSAGILLIGPLGTNFSEILVKILIFSFKKMHLKMRSRKWRPYCLGLNVLNIVISWHGNTFITSVPLWGEFTGHQCLKIITVKSLI